MKKLIAGALCALMLATPSLAYTRQEQNMADAMKYLNLFVGTDKGYELERSLNREEGVTLLVGMLGKKEEAARGDCAHPFNDVSPWAQVYVAYAWENQLTAGISATEFGGMNAMTDNMFLTMTLKALGYSADGEDKDFDWQSPYALAKETGLTGSEEPDTEFLRGDALEIFWNALDTKLKDQRDTLAEVLVEQGAFTQKELEKARDIYQNGTETSGSSGGSGSSSGSSSSSGSDSTDSSGGGVVPSTPDTPVQPAEPDKTDKPDTPAGPETPAEPDAKPEDCTWEQYQAMTAEEQWAFYQSFDSPSAYFDWMAKAKEEYEANRDVIDLGDGGSIDLGDYIKP